MSDQMTIVPNAVLAALLEQLIDRYATMYETSLDNAKRIVETSVVRRGLESLQRELDGEKPAQGERVA